MTTWIFPSSQDATECESGCRCPVGLFDDGKGSCVNQNECPCQHDGHLYITGKKIPNDCNTWYDLSFIMACCMYSICIQTFCKHIYLIILFKTLCFQPFLMHLVPAKVEPGSAQRKNVPELALFMGVVTTIHLIRKHMSFKEVVLMLQSR